MQVPAISVVLPTYNRANLLKRAIDSVLSQTFSDFELIIVDDNSPDDTSVVIQQVKDRRIRYFRHDQNRGSSATRNTGIRNSRADFVSFLDDDDEFLPYTLTETFRLFQQLPSTVGYVVGAVIDVSDTMTGEVVTGERYPQTPAFRTREEMYFSFLRHTPFGTGHGVSFRRAAFDKVGLFDEELRSSVDRDIFIRFARHFDYVTIPKPLVKVHKHGGGQLTNLSPKRIEDHERIAKKHIDSLRKNPSVHSDVLFNIGLRYYRCGEKKQGRKALIQSIYRYPFQAKAWLNLLAFELFGSDSRHLGTRLFKSGKL